MSAIRLTISVADQSAPVVRLLDARRRGLDDDGLRAWARDETRAAHHCSRSYCHPLALVATHSQPVGVDLERLQPVGSSFADAICTPEERRGGAAASDLIALWCGKEALAKSLGDPLRYDPRRLAAPQAWPNGRSGPWRAVELDVAPEYRAWACWRCLDAAESASRRRAGARS